MLFYADVSKMLTKRVFNLNIIGYLLFICFLLFAMLLRVVNLNYNTPFNDEAIYIVVGKLGLFQGDWYTYNPASWMGGHPLFYPVITALADNLGGIVASRLLNCLLGVLTVETIFFITLFILEEIKPTLSTFSKYLGASVSALALTISSTSLYVSRIATYDMPSFYLLFLSITLLFLAWKNPKNSGKWFFFSSLSLAFSYFFKVVAGFYLPFIVLFAFIESRSRGLISLNFWKKYFLYPIIFLFGVYTIFDLGPLITYLKTHAIREFVEYSEIMKNYQSYVYPLTGLIILGNLGLLIQRQWRYLFYLNFCAVWIVLSHLLSHRLATFDKHAYLSIAFFSLVCGCGLGLLVSYLKSTITKTVVVITLVGYFVLAAIFSYSDANQYNYLWTNTSSISEYLIQNTLPGDKILTESGASTILTLYDYNFPTNITTFDFLEYQKMTGDQAYIQALKDGYFDLIQLENSNAIRENIELDTYLLVKSHMENYKLSYSNSNFDIYKRIF